MTLLTQDLITKLPALYETEKVPLNDKVAMVKFFHPAISWTWYGIEFDGQDTFWGLVDGFEREYGYFSLSELQTPVGPFQLTAERDQHFSPTTLRDLDL